MNELVPKSFRDQAIAFPSRVEQALANVDTVDAAKDMLDKADAMRHYAQRLKASVEVEKPIALGVIKIKAKIGELMPAKQGKRNDIELPAGSTGSSSFNSHTLAAYRKLAANIDQLEAYAAESDDVPTQAGFIKHCTKPHVSNNSVENEWYTPAEIIELARGVMGSIDLDPASSSKAQETVKAESFYTAEDDGLQKEWFGTVWMNPPYQRGIVDKFALKLCESVVDGSIKQATVLVNNATETTWFNQLSEICSALCLYRGRIKFMNAEGKQANSPLQGQCVLYFGGRQKRFVKAWEARGACFVTPKAT